ncbi:hypothetical protein, partial [Faecalibaculum rodentium]|uniref:hypothetical protein n=1 Tax=Faecalibaculum rodentium TaxID=1702221 RepID=UPI00267037AB
MYQLDYSARHAPAKRQFGQTVTIGRGLFVTGDAEYLEELDQENVADIIELMDSDDAIDVL